MHTVCTGQTERNDAILIDYYPSFLAGNMLYENIVEKSFEENGFNDMFAICSVSQSETLPNGFTAAEALCPNPLKEIISLDELKQNENLTIYIDFRVYNEKFSQDFYKAYYEMYKQLKEFKCNFYITGYFAKSKIDTEYNLGSTMETNYKGDLCFSENLHCTVSANSFKNIKSVEDIAARAEMPSTNDFTGVYK